MVTGESGPERERRSPGDVPGKGRGPGRGIEHFRTTEHEGVLSESPGVPPPVRRTTERHVEIK